MAGLAALTLYREYESREKGESTANSGEMVRKRVARKSVERRDGGRKADVKEEKMEESILSWRSHAGGEKIHLKIHTNAIDSRREATVRGLGVLIGGGG